jgi:2-keto-4-pentenoate hydratase
MTTNPLGVDAGRIDRAAARLRAAYREGPIAPLREIMDSSDIEGAYSIQQANTRVWVDEGRRIIGRKIGLTSRAVQAQLGVDQPDFGVLFDDSLVEDGGMLAPSKLLQPRAEGEIAFVLDRDLQSPRTTRIEVLQAIAYALPAIEICDSRFADWKISIADTIADNASSGYFVLGNEPRRLAGLDLVTCGMVLDLDGTLAATGAGAGCMGDPLRAVQWLARTLAAHGQPLCAGDIVMSGALGPMVPIKPGMQVRVRIGGLGCAQFHYREC